MPHLLIELVLLLLNPSLICGQTWEGTLLGDKEEINQNVTYGDQESFQNQNHHYKRCDEFVLVKQVEPICWSAFNMSMVELGWENWCDWKLVLSHYNILMLCMKHGAEIANCYYPNHIVQEMFVNVHEQYFNSCVSEEEPLSDAPPSVLLTFTLLPISVIPVLVYMVIWKSSIRE